MLLSPDRLSLFQVTLDVLPEAARCVSKILSVLPIDF